MSYVEPFHLFFPLFFFFLLLFKTSPHLLRLFSRTLRCCFAPELFCGLWNFTRLSIGKSFVTICRQASAWQTALVPLCSTLEYYTHMWLLNLQFQKHGDKAFILKVLDRIKALCRSVKVFPNQQGEPCLYGAAFVCRDIIVLKRKKVLPPNYCHKCGISVSSIRPCGFLGHSVVISHSCPSPSSFPHWNLIPHLSTKLAGHRPVSSLLWGLLPHTTALVSSHAKQT